jgi:glycosyltransferase involved in cell wall biosynthesis
MTPQSNSEQTEQAGTGADSSPPLVSAIITTYNRPSYLERAVHSVLKQTYSNIELVVVDDHSDTHARETLAEIDLGELTAVTCVRHEENRGANAARNTGIEASSGEYIAFLDDDDRWVPEKIERQVDVFLDSSQDVGVVYAGIKKITENGIQVTNPPAIDGDMTKALLCGNVVGSMSVVMVRADLAKRVPLDEQFPSWADLEWYVNLSKHAEFSRIPEPLVVYDSRSHNRLSADLDKKLTAYELFVEEFGPGAREYGTLFYRKMRGWTAFRLGKAAYYRGYYGYARRYLALAFVMYPFERQFFVFLLLSLGGKPVHKTVRIITQ